MKQLSGHAVCNIPFRFLDEIYTQMDEFAMSSPLGPILVDIFIPHLEQNRNRFSSQSICVMDMIC